MNPPAESLAKRGYKTSVMLSIILIIAGFLAIASPFAASLGIAIVIGWLLLFGGFAQAIHAFESTGIGHITWKLVVALLYGAAGIYLIARPALGVAGLTLALGIFFFAEGIADMVAYFSTRKTGGSGWMFLDGAVTLVLGLMIWKQWPSSSLWGIGTLVGISMVMTGGTRLMMALAVRRFTKGLDDKPLRQNRAA
jgi:uncharacterized membrane protein HdeD (DUF308 family)